MALAPLPLEGLHGHHAAADLAGDHDAVFQKRQPALRRLVALRQRLQMGIAAAAGARILPRKVADLRRRDVIFVHCPSQLSLIGSADHKPHFPHLTKAQTAAPASSPNVSAKPEISPDMPSNCWKPCQTASQ